MMFGYKLNKKTSNCFNSLHFYQEVSGSRNGQIPKSVQKYDVFLNFSVMTALKGISEIISFLRLRDYE